MVVKYSMKNQNEVKNGSSSSIQQPSLSFATLDDVKDVDVKSGSSNHGGGSLFNKGDIGSFLDDDTAAGLMWPICLILVWMVVYMLEVVISDNTAVGLRHWPVVIGNVSSLAVLKPMTAWVAKIMLAHRFLGAILFVFNRILVFVAMIISSICAGFIHMSLGHVFGNGIILLIVSGAGLAIMYPIGRLMKNWLILSATGIGFTWLIIDLLSFFMQGTSNHTGWLYEVCYSITPIVGASVGVYGLVGMMIVLLIKSVRDSRVAQLLLIVMVIIAISLLYSRFVSLNGVHVWTNTGAALKLSVWMHFVGFILGIIRGIQDRTMLGY